MQQKINLLFSLPGRKRIVFPARFLLLLSCMFVGIILLMTGIMGLRYMQYHFELKRLGHERLHAEVLFVQMAEKYPWIARGEALQSKIETLTHTLTEQTEAWKTLKHATLLHGFSDYMRVLSARVPDRVWLQVIEIDLANKQIFLSGHSVSPAAVLRLIQNLKEDPLFREKKLEILKMETSSSLPQYTVFEIGSPTLVPNIKGGSE